MPSYFRDIFEQAALKMFTRPYEDTVIDSQSNSSSSSFSSNDESEGSVVLYARDYRELSLWIPQDAAYVVGRFMYEADGLPRPWVRTANSLNEIWVPSR